MHPIVRTVLQRLGLGLLTLFVVSVIIFSSLQFLPGDFATSVLGQSATPETVAAFRRELGLNEPAITRYIQWIGGVLQGDFGSSFSGRSQGREREVMELIGPRLWNTLFLAGMTAIIAVPLALTLGITAALYRNSFYDRAVNATTLTTISFPEFFVAYILILVLATLWKVFPSLANVREATELADRIYMTALPALTLTLVIVAHMMRMTRAAIINLLASPYIEMARTQGRVQIQRHHQACAAQRLGTDRQRDCLQPGLPGCRRGGGGSGVCLPRCRAVDGGCCNDARHSGGAGVRFDLCGHLHPFEPVCRHCIHRNQSEAVAPKMSTDDQTYSAAGEVASVAERRTWWDRTWRNLKKAPVTAWFGMIVISFYLVVAIFAPLVAPYGESEIFDTPYAPWSSEFWFGTDQLGRDVLSRLIYGARNTIGIAVATTALSFLIGGSLGVMAAINRSWLDQGLSRFVDVLMAIPSLIFSLMLLSIFGSNVFNLIIIIAVLDATRVFRLARAVSLNVVVMDYVEASRLRGESLAWVMRRDILPNILPPMVAEFGLRFCFVFLTIASLSFLGVGIQPPTADWGSMVRENAQLISFAEYDMKAAMTPLLPAGAIALLTVAVNFVVDWFLHKTSGIRDEK